MSMQSPHSALNPERLPRPFTVGLKAFDPVNWIVPDVHLADQVRQKAELFESRHEAVFRAEPDTVDAQGEVLDMLLAYLAAHHPQTWQVGDGEVSVVPAGLTYRIDEFAARPLELACRLIQDDLVIMRKGEGGYRIAAAAVCFPSTWVLADKFGKAIADVHGPVPGFERGTRQATVVDRIFDNLKVGAPVERCNWSVYEVADLHHPKSHSTHTRWQGRQERLLLDSFLRAERQTLTRLPGSGDVVFTIQIIVDPAGLLLEHPERAQIAATLKAHVESLNEAELAYKGMTGYQDMIVAELTELAGG
jgi:hypothetical protein